MADENFVLKGGENLVERKASSVSWGEKQPPYSFEEARQRLLPMLSQAVQEIEQLPDDACPRDQAVIELILNPEYIAKSYFPSQLFRETNIDVVGSSPVEIIPEKRSGGRDPKKAVTTKLFARAGRDDFQRWHEQLPEWSEKEWGDQLPTIESIRAPSPHSKIKGELEQGEIIPIEVVLHAHDFRIQELKQSFLAYLQNRNLGDLSIHQFETQELYFCGLNSTAEKVEEIAAYSAIRVLRRMPKLRGLKPMLRSVKTVSPPVRFPEEPAVSKQTRIAVFDGGIPDKHPLTRWVTPKETSGLADADEESFDHGVEVTSALLFGHIDPEKPLPRPFAAIDHYRVVDKNTYQPENPYELYEVLDRIKSVLTSKRLQYDFFNLSLGPAWPIDDEEVHAWTAFLDEHLAGTVTLATIAVGNDGEADAAEGLNRIQVPSDCVNAMAIGACDATEGVWKRTNYSSVGPGRIPGRVKPELVAFGGNESNPFHVLECQPNPKIIEVGGTSFAAPSVLRMASGVKAYFGSDLNTLAIRALLVHTAEEGEPFPSQEVGWGRCAQSLSDIVVCREGEVRVVYQGKIEPAKSIRVPIPTPNGGIKGMVNLKATICYKTRTDPHHPSNYTQAGLSVIFRPHNERYASGESKSIVPKSAAFFGPPPEWIEEVQLRRDAWKWENCLKASKRKRGSSLRNPVFDIHYNARDEGHSSTTEAELQYALVVSVQARNMPDLYQQVLEQYRNRLEPLRSELEIPLQI